MVANEVEIMMSPPRMTQDWQVQSGPAEIDKPRDVLDQIMREQSVFFSSVLPVPRNLALPTGFARLHVASCETEPESRSK
jgi:hypothetical protein